MKLWLVFFPLMNLFIMLLAVVTFPLTILNGSGPVGCALFGSAFTYGNVYVESSETLNIATTNGPVLVGDVTVRAGGELVVNGFIMISGDITIEEGASVTGSSAWQLNPAWRWTVRYLMGGWYWPWAHSRCMQRF